MTALAGVIMTLIIAGVITMIVTGTIPVLLHSRERRAERKPHNQLA